MSEKTPQIIKEEKALGLTKIIGSAIQIPGVKVTRDSFLREQFKTLPKEELDILIEKGPVEAGCSREELQRKANRIIKERTALSTGTSFVAGLPGGLTMAATIPADILQFYAVALRMAQELVYLYGESDIWCEGTPDPDKVTNQLILYCGVMLGASGAAQTVRVMSSALAKQALIKLPRQALTKTAYYPIIKTILKFFGLSITKNTFAKGVSKAIPVVGGVISGSITLASILPMGNRLAKALDTAHFDYTTEDLKTDIQVITQICMEEEKEEPQSLPESPVSSANETLEKIKQAKQMLDEGVLTEEEFSEIKEKLISNL